MAYQDRDESVESANPLLLFQFAQGSTVFRYALATESVDVAADGHTWTPAVIIPGEFSHAGEVGKNTLTIGLASSDPLAQSFTGGVPDVITTVTVFRTFTDPGTELMMVWKGRVETHGFEPGQVTLNCDPIFTQLQRPGLRALYSRMCRHVLYGRGCNLSSSSFDTQLTVHQVSGAIVTLPSGAQASGYWDGGIFEAPDGTKRMILKHVGDKLTLIRPIRSLITYVAAHPDTGATVHVYRGCDHSYAMCKERFNNAGNYGGDPWFAQKNPFSTQVSFV
jgi:hypothetical protein